MVPVGSCAAMTVAPVALPGGDEARDGRGRDALAERAGGQREANGEERTGVPLDQ